MLKLIFITLALSIFSGSVYAQSSDDRPLFGSVLMGERSWNMLSDEAPDYATVAIRQDIPLNNSIEKGDSDQCSGYTLAAPFYVVDWRRKSYEEEERLRIFFINRNDLNVLLYIEHADGRKWCNDNGSSNTENPLIDLERPRSGEYKIWVLSPTPSTLIEGTIYFTLEDYDTENYKLTATDMPDFIALSSASAGVVTYVLCIHEFESLRVSVDAEILLPRNVQVRLLVKLNDEEVMSAPQRARTDGVVIFSYIKRSDGLAFEINHTLQQHTGAEIIINSLSLQMLNEQNLWVDIVTNDKIFSC